MGTIKELKVLVDALRVDVAAIQNAPTSVQSLTKTISELKAAHDNEIRNYQRKIEDLELKLSTAAKASSTATLDAVTRFYNTLDAKVDKHNVRLNILEDDTVPSVEEALKNHKKHLDTINEQITANRTKSKYNESQDHREDTRNELSTKNENMKYVNSSKKIVTLASLEARVDKLEDFSRRDNLLFTGIEENSNENCENTVRDILARKLLYKVCDVNKIVIVRAHRLGRFKSGQTRPIIVKFREYADKQMILQQVFKGKLINTGLWATEDFSVNTTEDRKYLRTHLNAAKNVLNGKIKTSSVRYKAIHITNTDGGRFVFPLHKVENNPQTWWKAVGAEVVSDIQSSEQDLHQYPDGASTPEDFRDAAEEAPAEEAHQDSDGTQNPVEPPKEGAVPATTAVEEPNAP